MLTWQITGFLVRGYMNLNLCNSTREKAERLVLEKREARSHLVRGQSMHDAWYMDLDLVASTFLEEDFSG